MPNFQTRGRALPDRADWDGEAGSARVHEGPYAADTIPPNTSTTEVIAAPGTRTSAIDTIGDFDFFRITLEAGHTYTFALNSAGGSGGLNDPSLALYNSAGTLITLDDDSGPGFNALITYTAPSSGDYYLGANGIPTSTGNYILVASIVGDPDTIPGDTTTTHSLAIDGAAQIGTVDSSGDADWFAITLTAGESYGFTLAGSGASALSDPFLRLYNSAGTLVSLDDDGGDGLNAMMQFTAVTSGTYFLSAGAAPGTGVGEYTIAAAHGPAQNPLDTLDLGFTFDTSNIVVYFATTGQNLGPEGPAARSFTASEQAALMAALQTIADVTDLTFTTTLNSAEADFIFSLDNLEPGLLGVTYPTPSSAYIVFGQSAPGWTTAGLMPGGLGFSVVIHEVGHALGLDHPHYDGGDNQVMQGVISEFGSYGTFGLNQQVFTVMSYNDGWVGPNGVWNPTPSDNYGFSATPMALDIAYLQLLYGADETRNSGDTVYTLLPFQASNPSYRTIWDVGGIDTIDAHPTAGAYIDLNAATLLNSGGGGFVSYSYDIAVYGGFTIANGVVIENAIGAFGNDTLVGNAVDNVLTGNGGDDTLRGGAGVDTLLGGEGDDVLEGGADADTLTGGAGADRLDGGAGADAMTGGAGNDRYIVTDAGDTISELAGEGTDTVDASLASFTLAANFENLNLAGTALDGTGNASANTIIGNAFANTILAGGGNDIVNGQAGDDYIDAGEGDDLVLARRQTFAGAESNVYVGGAGFDTIDFTSSTAGLTINLMLGTVTGGGVAGTDTLSGFERIVGSFHADVIIGDGADNWFLMPAGDDTFDGGDGIDTVEFIDQIASVNFVTGSGSSGGNVFSFANVENAIGVGGAVGNSANNLFVGRNAADLLRGGDGADRLLGLAGMDDLYGDEGDDVLIGGANGDRLDGGTGFDYASYETATAGVVADMMGGPQSGDAIVDTFVSVEGLIGSAYNDSLSGDNNANTLNGGAGADILIGLGGNDTYVVDDAGDTVTEGASAGTDLVQASATFGLTANIENLTLTGAGAISGFGNILNNTITGNGAANQLNGFDGADTLDGGAGADNMFGGNGDDAYIVDNAGDQTTEASALGGTDTVFASVNRNLTANIENLTLTGAGAITGAGNVLNNLITGNAGANTLYGFDGNDRLDGGTGADTLFGANGDDVYVVDDAGDITVEGSTTGGTDTVESWISRNMNANFENMTLMGTAAIAYGNVLNNVLTGNASANSLYGFDGADTLNGGAGADQMFGANGDDVYIVDNAGDVTSEVSAGGGVDTVMSSVTRNLTANLENLSLTGSADITGAGNALGNVITGNSGVNTLYGLDGADTLDGGLGADTLQGGLHADSYVFSSALGGGNVDAIVGFNVADDTIVLNNAVFTGLGAGTLDAGAFVIGSAAADADDRIIYNGATGQLLFDADGDGAGAAILFATLAPGLALTNNDFIVSGP